MRIIVNGQQAFGKAVLDALIERGDSVAAVFCAPDKEGRRVDSLKEAALAHGLALHQPASYKDPATLDQIRALEPDLMVMAYVTVFVPEAARSLPSQGAICFHPSLLPRHRGPSSINWPIIAGETKTGLTIFYPNDGLDEGDILLQKEVEIGPDDTLGSVYFDKIFALGVAAMLEAVDLVKQGTAPRIPQDKTQASYESWCRKPQAEIDWSQPVDAIYNLIRGTNPQPGAWTRLDGKELQIFDAEKLDGAEGSAGEVTALTEAGFTIGAKGGQILVKRVRPEGAGKSPAAEFAAAAGLRVGKTLG